MTPDETKVAGSESTRQHGGTGPAAPQPPEPTHAEQVRTLLALNTIATLSTMSRKVEGFPFGSLMPYAVDGQGRPLLLISTMAMHTQNLKADARASLFVTESAAEGEALGAARATLVGLVQPVPACDLETVRPLYLEAHENSRYWVDFADFAFFRLEVQEVYYVGGFGVMGWVPADAYRSAEPDPLARESAAILRHMNADHVEAMILLARRHAGLEAIEAAMISVDRLGFRMRLKTDDGMKGARVNYRQEARTPQQVRAALVELVKEARQSAG